MISKFMPLTLTVKDAVDESKFIVPRYQRNVVWGQKRREEFMDTVRKGDPFGIILVRQREGKYELIDGLQRITTLKKYRSNKFDFLDYNEISVEMVQDLIKRDLEIQGVTPHEKFLNDKIPVTQKIIFDSLAAGKKNYQIMSSLRSDHGIKDDSIIDDIINQICVRFEEKTSIDGLTIMAIDYHGEDENIPNVFYNMNTGGVTLSKYETYAALWASWTYLVEDKEILESVQQKYEDIQNMSDLEVNFNPDDFQNEGITLFEYCYALSDILRTEYKIIFGKSGKSTDPLGFEILTLLAGESVNKAENLPRYLKEAPSDFLVRLKEIIKDTSSAICHSLKDTVCGMNGSDLCADSSYLIYHIIFAYIDQYYFIDYHNYTISTKENTISKENFRKYLPYHYVFDCITNYWQLHRQVSELAKDINNKDKLKKYWYKIAVNDWIDAMDNFISEQNTISKNIPYNNKLFLDFYYRLKLDHTPTCRRYFIRSQWAEESIGILDIEHIIPKNTIFNHIRDISVSDQKIFPISSIGNLCYLSATDNRSKRDKTIYQFKENRPSYIANRDYLNFLLYPEEAEIGFIDYNSMDFRDHYKAFVEERANKIKDDFISLIKK